MKKPFFAAATFLLCGVTTAQELSVQDQATVVSYLFNVFHGKEALTKAILRKTPSEPELTQIAQEASASFDANEFSFLLAQPLSASLSPGEVTQCIDFIRSPNGGALREASERATSSSELPKQLSSLPSLQQEALMNFFGSSCFKKTMAFLGSPAAQEIARNYGNGLVCRYAEHTRPEMLSILRVHGKCQTQ